MSKVLVEVFIPAARRTYDVFIPHSSRLSEVLMLLNKIAPELSDGYFIASNDTVLCRRHDGLIYNQNMTVEELCLENGAQLMLI